MVGATSGARQEVGTSGPEKACSKSPDAIATEMLTRRFAKEVSMHGTKSVEMSHPDVGMLTRRFAKEVSMHNTKSVEMSHPDVGSLPWPPRPRLGWHFSTDISVGLN